MQTNEWEIEAIELDLSEGEVTFGFRYSDNYYRRGSAAGILAVLPVKTN